MFATLPYAILTLLVIRGSLLEGAGEGIKFYLKPRVDRLGHVRTWLDAFNQIIYSLGIGTGQMVAYGSYTESNEDIVLDAGCISLLNSFTSLYAGVAVFAMLGHKAHKDGSSVADVVQSGEGLAFVAIPDGLSELPAAGLWCFIFRDAFCVGVGFEHRDARVVDDDAARLRMGGRRRRAGVQAHQVDKKAGRASSGRAAVSAA